MSPVVPVSPSTITMTLCCLVLNSRNLQKSTQLSTTYTPDRVGPTSDPVESKLLLQIIPGKINSEVLL